MSNCLIFAVLLLVRRLVKFKCCYIGMRKSHNGWFPHFLFKEKRRGRWRIISYKPIHPQRRLLPPPRFAGYAAWGDTPPKKD